MQADWGYLGTFMLDGRLRRVYVFTMVMGYSRFMAAYCTTAMDLESLLLAHQHCFADIGGVTKQVVYDNMKTVTLGRNGEHRPIWQERFADFAVYHDFKPAACSPRKLRSKGKVESAVGYIKRNFCPGRRFGDLTDLNQQLGEWLRTVANARHHGTTRAVPAQRLLQESLQPLPAKPFKTMIRFPRQVSRDSFVSYQGVLYSVPWQYAGGSVHVEEMLEGQIRIWWNGDMVAEHHMPADGRRRVYDPKHNEGLVSAQAAKQSTGLLQCFPEVEHRPLSVYESLGEVAQ